MSVYENLLRYKDIILYRTEAGIKSEARQNYLGYVWFLFEPMLSTAVLYFAWSHISGSKGFDPIMTILIGMVAWNWFEGSVMMGANAIKAKFHVLNQFALPKYLFPVVTILVNTWKSMFVFGVILLMAGVHGTLGVHTLWLPVVLALQLLLIVALTLPLSIAITLFNDLNTVVSSIFRLLFFVSGLFFTAEELAKKSPEAMPAFFWNPMSILIEAYRDVIQRGASPSPALLARVLLIAGVLIVTGLALQARYDKKILKLTNV